MAAAERKIIISRQLGMKLVWDGFACAGCMTQNNIAVYSGRNTVAGSFVSAAKSPS
jgi:hypothetical protein